VYAAVAASRQWEFRACGAGFIINNVCVDNLFLTLRDWKGLQLEGSAKIVAGTFPTCWEVEVMDYGTEDEPGRDVYVR